MDTDDLPYDPDAPDDEPEPEPAPVRPRRGRPPGSRTRREPAPPPAPYRDPISVEVTMKSGDTGNFDCVAYDVSGPTWRFKSFPPERGRQTVRLMNPSEVALIRIDEPEGNPSGFGLPPPPPQTYPAYPTGYQGGNPQHAAPAAPSAPVSYVAKEEFIKDQRARRAQGGIIHGVPQSVIDDDNGNPTVTHAAMLPGGVV